MTPFFDNVLKPFSTVLGGGLQSAGDWFTRETHRFTITGLSRSGKSMLFTSLMTVLKYRSEEKYNCLPLLKCLPMELVETMWLEPLDDFLLFPIEEHIEALENGQWPAPTESLYGFKLVVRLRQHSGFKKYLLSHTHVVFEFIDYPGEWITDLPMQGKSFSAWSDTAWAQQLTDPQRFYAGAWHEFANQYDFDKPPNEENMAEVVTHYRSYLLEAKAQGISMLQPGSFLISGSGFNWQEKGFAPLPSKITSDVTHPWFKAFSANYAAFCDEWLSPLKEKTFRETDKQIILVDLFEGLSHSKQHLYQLKETLSHLAETFVYGNPGWFSRYVLRKRQIGRVAFVATKADLIPESEKQNLLGLLKEVSAGATAKFDHQEVQFDHFLVTAIQATDAGSSPSALRYTAQSGRYTEAEFETLPASIKGMSAKENYPALATKVPDDYLPRILNGRGLDRLLQFLLG